MPRLCIVFVLLLLLPLAAEEDGGGLFGPGGGDDEGGGGFQIEGDDDEGDDAAAEAEDAAQAEAEAARAENDEAGGRTHSTHTGWLSELRAWAGGKGMPVAVQGDGMFRFVTVGNVTIPKVEELIAVGEQALQGMETWTGNNGLFLRDDDGDEQAYLVVLIQGDGQFNSFIDHMRRKGLPKPEGEDLTKKLHFQWGTRCAVLTAGKFLPIARNWAANLAGGAAIITFYQEHGRKPPKWLRAACCAELERLLCDGSIRITTIAYEMGGGTGLSTTWARDVAKLVQQGSDLLLRATWVLDADLIQTPPEHYKQLWSFFTFLLAQRGGKGERNKLAEFMRLTAQGETQQKAIQQVWGLADPRLTRVWLRWAGKQR